MAAKKAEGEIRVSGQRRKDQRVFYLKRFDMQLMGHQALNNIGRKIFSS
jgi:hypothetical protein